jgi:GntR family transcriptional regulator
MFRRIATAAIVTNTAAMALAYDAHDWRTFTISWLGAGVAGAGRIFFVEEAQRMGETGTGYRSLAMRLRWEMKEANLEPGTALPSVRDYARLYGTTRVTVRHALQLLVEEGLIVIVPMKGVFVAGPKPVRTQEVSDV